MQPEILFVSKKENTGGAAYEDQIKKILEGDYVVSVLELNSKKNNIFFFTKLKYAYQIKSYKPGKKYDILITNKAGVYAGILKKQFNKKILIFHHYFSEESAYPVVRSILKNRLLSNLKNFDHIIVVADYWKKFVAQYVDERKIYLICNSFNTKKIDTVKRSFQKTDFKKKYNIPDDKIIVYAGNALKIKGYLDVIAQLDAAKYFIITSGNKDKNTQLKHLHLQLDATEYIQLLCAADITVILSKFQEGWNRIAHESLICGTRVIGTDIAGFGELLHNASQIIYRDGDNLQELISKALDDDKLVADGMNYASQFNLEYLNERWKTFLLQMWAGE